MNSEGRWKDSKLNCWEFMGCEYLPDGAKRTEVCPVFMAEKFNGINDGKAGGRYCWQVNKALCQTGISDFDNMNPLSCSMCEFFKYVKRQESTQFRA